MNHCYAEPLSRNRESVVLRIQLIHITPIAAPIDEAAFTDKREGSTLENVYLVGAGSPKLSSRES